MDAQQTGRAGHRGRIVVIVVAGLVAIAGAFGYLAYARGAFAKRDKVAIVTWNQDPFWGPMRQGATDAAREVKVDLTFIESEPDPAAQARHVREALDGGAVAVAISPNGAAGQPSIIDQAAARAVVVTFDSDAPTSKRQAFVGTDDYDAGQMAADEVRAACPKGGKVIVSVGSIGMNNGRDRRQGLIDDLLDRPTKREPTYDPAEGDLKGKTFDVVATVLDGGDRQLATDRVAAAIKANPDVACVVGLFSYSGPAILAALDKAGVKGKVKIVGFDESAAEQAAVASGAIYSSILQDQYHCGYLTVEVMTDLLRGTAQFGPGRPQVIKMPTLVMRADNIASLRHDRVIREVDAK